MSTETTLLEHEVASSSSQERQPQWDIWSAFRHYGPIFTSDPTTVGYANAALEPLLSLPTAASLMNVYDVLSTRLLDLTEDLYVRFPPKKARVVRGRISERIRATFRSGLLDDLLEDTSA